MYRSILFVIVCIFCLVLIIEKENLKTECNKKYDNLVKEVNNTILSDGDWLELYHDVEGGPFKIIRHVKVSENGKFASTNLEPEEIDIVFEEEADIDMGGTLGTNNLRITLEENIAKDHNTPLVTEPTMFVYEASDDPGEYVYFPTDEKHMSESLFLMLKAIVCSDNPFAKELVEKYKITSDTVECPGRWDHPKSSNPQM